MSKPKLNTLYTSMILSLGLKVDEETNGVYEEKVSRVKEKIVKSPVTIISADGVKQKLTMPAKEVLDKGLDDNMVAFHPLSESLVRGESEVLACMRHYMKDKTNVVLCTLMGTLATIASDPELQNNDTVDLTKAVPGTDATFAKNVMKLAGKVAKGQRLTNIFLKQGGLVDGKKFHRAAIVDFNVTPDKKRTLYGVALRVHDVKSLDNLVEFILPGYKDQAYCVGSDSDIAPFFDALLKAWLGIAEMLNARIEEFEPWIDGAEDLMINTDWESLIGEFSAYYREILPLKGNMGTVEENEPVPESMKNLKVKVDMPRPEGTPIEPITAIPESKPLPQASQPVAPNNGYTGGAVASPVIYENQNVAQNTVANVNPAPTGGAVSLAARMGGTNIPQQQPATVNSVPQGTPGYLDANGNFIPTQTQGVVQNTVVGGVVGGMPLQQHVTPNNGYHAPQQAYQAPQQNVAMMSPRERSRLGYR